MRQKNKYERENKEKKIIAAALEILEREGLKGVTMRRVADCLNMSIMNIYNYFNAKEDILFPAQIICLMHLRNALRAVKSTKELAPAYMDFAAENPHVYDLAMRIDGMQGKEIADLIDNIQTHLSSIRGVGGGVKAWARLHGEVLFSRSLLLIP